MEFSRLLPLARTVGLLAFAVCPAYAMQPLVTDDTGTQGTGHNQLEFSINRATAKEAGAKETTTEYPLGYTRGLMEVLDVYVGTGWQSIKSTGAGKATGWGNPALGLKWRFYDDEASKLSMGIKPEIQFPVSASKEAQGLGSAATSYGVTFLLTQETRFGAVHFNVAANRANSDDPANSDRRNLWRVSLAPVWDVSEHLKLAVDLGLSTNPDSSQKSGMGYILLGAVYAPRDDMELSLGYARDLMDGPVKSDLIAAGLTWHF